jgi:isocitrate/isopropylmalate dehydrogenase
MKSYRIAAIPGDGIGKEVIAAGVEVLTALASRAGFGVTFDHFDWGSDYYKKHGVTTRPRTCCCARTSWKRAPARSRTSRAVFTASP